MANALEKLKALTTVVADTGDFESMKNFKPQDATTNPSLILAAASMDQYKAIMDKAVAYGKAQADAGLEGQVEAAVDKLFVLFGYIKKNIASYIFEIMPLLFLFFLQL